MKLQNVFQDTIVLGFVVPLAITPLGLIYLNDHGVWTVSYTHLTLPTILRV